MIRRFLSPVSAVVGLKKDGDVRQHGGIDYVASSASSPWFDVSSLQRDRCLVATSGCKDCQYGLIGNYFNKRLGTVFAGVAPTPYTYHGIARCAALLALLRSRRPIRKLQIRPAVRIAQDILKREPVKSAMLPFGG